MVVGHENENSKPALEIPGKAIRYEILGDDEKKVSGAEPLDFVASYIMMIHISWIDYVHMYFVDAFDERWSPGLGRHSRDPTNIKAQVKFVVINYPLEYITQISGSFELVKGKRALASLTIVTNLTSHGPFVIARRTSMTSYPFSHTVKPGCRICGFFATTVDKYICSLGVYEVLNPPPIIGLQMVGQINGGELTRLQTGGRDLNAHWGFMYSDLKQILVEWTTGHLYIAFTDILGQSTRLYGRLRSEDAKPVISLTTQRKFETVEINYPSEYITGVSGSFEIVDKSDQGGKSRTLASLTIVTNLNTYGPFGDFRPPMFTSPFSYKAKPGYRICGFFGTYGDFHKGSYITTISSYECCINMPLATTNVITPPIPSPSPATTSSITPQIPSPCPATTSSSVSRIMSPIYVKPWGGPGGKSWNFIFPTGTGDKITGIEIAHETHINSIRFITTNGSSPKFGGTGGTSEQIRISREEHLTGISGTFNNVESLMVVTSLRFYTSKSEHGPYGIENGTNFSMVMGDGSIVGFHGRSGTLLDAIGVHVFQSLSSTHK